LQKESKFNSQRRAEASKLLSSVAQKWRNPRLAAIALGVRLDAFTKVKKAIDDLVAVLLENKEEEIKKRDFCIDEFNTNQLQTEKKEDEKKDVIAKIDDLEATIKALTEAIEALEVEIEEMQVQLKRAGEDREKENQEFQMTVADQRETQKLLQAALRVLEGFYGKPAPLLLQKQEPVGPPPPPGFEEYKKSGASGDVMAMISQIIVDSKAMEAETIRSEADAQKAYESFVAETNASIDAKQKEIVSKSEDKAKAEKDLVETKEEKEAVMLELEGLSNYNAEMHSECDFTLKNFEVRQTARDEEIEALRQAKAILSGSKFGEFLQRGY
jgi:outer membrane murein-binding lipoprotein Lpp